MIVIFLLIVLKYFLYIWYFDFSIFEGLARINIGNSWNVFDTLPWGIRI